MFVCPLRCLKRINFLSAFYDCAFDVRSSRTFSCRPFAGRVGINLAVLARGNIEYFGAITAQLQNSMTAPSIESTTFLGHEAAILSVFDGLTNHGKLTPSILLLMGPEYLTPMDGISKLTKTPKWCAD
jgi:hypothetical protein